MSPEPRESSSLERYIEKIVDAAPPLTVEQRDRIAVLLRWPSGRSGGVADAA